MIDQEKGENNRVRNHTQIYALVESGMGAIHYKPTNCSKTWPVMCKFTGRKRRKATTSWRPSFINGKEIEQKARKEQKMMVSSLST
jgi:hypothetical protein